MRISDWSSDVCSSDLAGRLRVAAATTVGDKGFERTAALVDAEVDLIVIDTAHGHNREVAGAVERVKKLSNSVQVIAGNVATAEATRALRSEEHTSELQSLMRISYAVFCLKKKKHTSISTRLNNLKRTHNTMTI